jgi:hypothetical protein
VLIFYGEGINKSWRGGKKINCEIIDFICWDINGNF